MENVPVEIVTHILAFLNPSDRRAASLVSKRWYEASLDPLLHTKTVINLRASTATQTSLKDLAHRQSPHLVVSFADGATGASWVIREMGRHLGPHLESLSLYGCDIMEDMFLDIIQHCSNLQSLDLSCCNSLFMSGTFLKDVRNREVTGQALKKLKKIKLNSLRFLSDVLFNRLVECTPNLEDISLSGCNLAFQTDPCNKENMESVSFVTFTNLRSFLEKRAGIMTGLDLSKTFVTSAALQDISTIPKLGLERVVLDKCTNVSNKGLAALASSSMPIESLSFMQCDGVTSVAIAAIANNMTSLKSLKFSGVRNLPDNVVGNLFARLSDITALSVSCSDLRSKGIVQGLTSVDNSRLTKLSLSGSSIDDSAVFAIGKAAPNLTLLNLQSCQLISDYSLIIISQSFPELRGLNLAWCTAITDFGVLGLEKYDPLLAPEKKLHYSDRFTRSHSQMGFFTVPKFDERIQTINEKDLLKAVESRKCKGLMELKKLESLDLSNCPHLTDVSLERGMAFPNLRSLQLSFCRNLTDEGFKALAQSNVCLEVLSIAHCHLLTNGGLQSLTHSLRRLTHLDLTGCTKLGNQSLEIIAGNCQRLKHINLSLCGMIEVSAIKRLQKNLPSLQNVQFGHTGSYLAPLSHPDFF